jgi:hypothetical protein
LEELNHLIIEWLVADMKAAFSPTVCRKAPVISFLRICRVVIFSLMAYSFIHGGYYLVII